MRFLVFLFCISRLNGQTTSLRTWDSSAIEMVVLELPYASSISIKSTKTETISTHYQSEGEYQNALLLSASLNGSVLSIKEQIGPGFKNFNDKLSAHKVMASTLDLYLPEKLFIELNARSAKVTLEGEFPRLMLYLEEGNLYVNSFYVQGKITTASADVFLNRLNYPVHAETRNGVLKGTVINAKTSVLKIKSVDGNISFNSD